MEETVAFPVKNCADEAALALESTGTGLGTENATATIYHPDISRFPFVSMCAYTLRFSDVLTTSLTGRPDTQNYSDISQYN